MSEQAVFDALKYHIEVDDDGSRRYYNTNGELHRTDGPAVEYADGGKGWCQTGQLHRIDGPAITRVNGHKEWWQNDLCHRTDGPAVEWNDSDEWWFINGERLSKGEFNLIVEQNV